MLSLQSILGGSVGRLIALFFSLLFLLGSEGEIAVANDSSDVQYAFCGAAVVFESTRDGAAGTREIYLSSPDGSYVVRLMESSADDRLPNISPDGSTLAFRSNRDGDWGVYTLDIISYLALTGVTQVKKIKGFEGSAGSPYFTADGGYITFSGRDENGRDSFYVYDLETENLDLLLGLADFDREFSAIGHPVLSSDGHTLVFNGVLAGESDSEVFTVRRDGTNLKQITDNDDVDDWFAQWSPDGSQIAFAGHQTSEVYVYDLESGTIENVSDHPAHDTDPAWTGDGKSLVFGSFRSGVSNIWTLNLKSREIRNISRSHHHEGHGDVAWAERCYDYQ